MGNAATYTLGVMEILYEFCSQFASSIQRWKKCKSVRFWQSYHHHLGGLGPTILGHSVETSTWSTCPGPVHFACTYVDISVCRRFV